jgi:hypothetical protein
VSAAEKLRAKMRESQDGWNADDLKRLYVGHGFDVREGAKHRVFKHPTFKYLRQVAIRDGKAPAAYVEDALELLDRLDELMSRGPR